MLPPGYGGEGFRGLEVLEFIQDPIRTSDNASCGPGDFLKIRIRAIDGGERTGDMKHKGDNAAEGKRKRVRERDKG